MFDVRFRCEDLEKRISIKVIHNITMLRVFMQAKELSIICRNQH